MTTMVSHNSSLVDQLNRLDSARLRAYRDNLSFYRGEQWAGGQRRRERRLVFNYAKALIDKTTSYLMSGIGFAVDPAGPGPEAAERAARSEAALRSVYEANNLAQLDFDSEIDASILGDGAMKVTWDPLERRVRISARMSRASTPGGSVTTSHASGGSRAATTSRPKRRRSCMATPCRLSDATELALRTAAPKSSTPSSKSGRRTRSSCGSTALSSRERRTRTASSRSSSIPTCASRSSSGAPATSRRCASRSGS